MAKKNEQGPTLGGIVTRMLTEIEDALEEAQIRQTMMTVDETAREMKIRHDSFLSAGFSEDQAMELCRLIMEENLRHRERERGEG